MRPAAAMSNQRVSSFIGMTLSGGLIRGSEDGVARSLQLPGLQSHRHGYLKALAPDPRNALVFVGY